MQEKPNDYELKYGNKEKKHDKKAECITIMTKELEGFEGSKAEIRTHRSTQNDTKNIKLENARPGLNTWFLV